MSRILLMSVGWIAIGLGVVGIFLPLLPTTPFLLLAAWCFANSSERCHQWLIDHPQLGPIVKAWRSGLGLPRQVRNRAILFMWLTMCLSMLIIGKLWAVALLGTIGACTTTYILRQPVLR